MQLPFKLHSVPKISTAMANSSEWIAKRTGVRLIEHHLDNFIMMGSLDDNLCKWGLNYLITTCAELGVSFTRNKQEDQCTRLTLLGIEMDSKWLPMPTNKKAGLYEKIARRME